MDLKSILVYLIVFWIGVFIGALGKETVALVVKMLSGYVKQKLIENGIIKGDFPASVLKYHPSNKKLTDSDWNIRILHPEKAIQNCEVRINGKRLSWRDNRELEELGYRQYIQKFGGLNIHIPKDTITENTKVQVWDGKEILLNIKFEDLPLVKE